MNCRVRTHRNPNDVCLFEFQMVHYGNDVVPCKVLGIQTYVSGDLGWWIASRIKSDALIASGKKANLRLPTTIISPKLVNEDYWNAASRCLIVKLRSISISVWH